METSNRIYQIYRALFKKYGYQGWWPFINDGGYHKGDYSYPKNENQIFEVCLGSILTQNTTFTSVVKSLNNLNQLGVLNIKAIETLDLDILKQAIKPSGYFNQKARYILEFIKFYHSLDGRVPKRSELLKVIGIGEETADSILLFGYKQPEFKVDAYTKRLFLHLGLVDEKVKYIDIKSLVEKNMKMIIKDKEELVNIYQEFHALIVEHGKEFYSRKPYGLGCFLE